MQDSKLLVAGSISSLNNALTGQDLTGTTTASAALSAYSVDLNPNAQTGVDIGEGSPVYLKWLITASITGASGLTIGIVSDATPALNSAAAQTLVSASAAALSAGTWGYLQVPPQISSNGQEFLGASFLPVGAAISAGKIIAEFTNSIDDPKTFYKSGFSVV